MAGSDEETGIDPLPSVGPEGALAAGTLLNGLYRVEERLGGGGMGEVYRATNIANDEQDAVKVIGHGLAGKTAVEAMFRKEARVLAGIHSPAVARLKLFARDDALDLLYFVTEFVPGEALLDRLRRRPAMPGELRALMARLLKGLAAVHEAGAVHRDLSPDNIILPDGDVARAKIIDFGIAKELDPARTTMVGDSFAGKLGYIAPEQLGFSGAQVGPWTDLYSLALVGVAFAAGRPLDMGATVGRAEEARRGQIDLSAVPDDLRPVFARLLTYDWQARPRSAGEVLTMLDADAGAMAPVPPVAVVAAPVVAAPFAPGGGGGRPVWPWLVIAGILLLLFIGSAIAVMVRTRPTATPPLAVAPRPTQAASPPDAVGPAVVAPSTDTPPAGLRSPFCKPPIRIAFPRNGSTSIGMEPLIAGALDRVALCRPPTVTVIGRADTGEQSPMALAGRRAALVAAALRAAGLTDASLRTRVEVGTPSRTDVFQNKEVEISFGGDGDAGTSAGRR